MPDTPTEEALERARVLFAGASTFLRGCTDTAQLPPDDKPEIAFAGRSNVGKSSLLNALTGRKKLAFASAAPGRTREVNLFDIGGVLYLVDLPGYGFAKAPKPEIARWTKLMKAYLRGRANLKRVFLLIDSRHGIKENDREMMEMLDECAVSYQLVLTKTDKLTAAQTQAMLEKTRVEAAKHPAAHPVVLATSAEKGDGIPFLREAAASLAEGY